MNVLYITHDAGLQGAGFALLNIIKGLEYTQYTPIVVLPDTGKLSEELHKINVQTFILPYSMDIYPPHKDIKDAILFFPRLIRTLIKNQIAYKRVLLFAKNQEISIIHTNTGVIHWGAKLAKVLHIPHVWHIREFQTLDFSYYPLFSQKNFWHKLSYSNNYCIAITQSVFDYHHLDKDKDIVIYDGVFNEDKLNIQFNTNNSDKQYFLFVGTLSPKKGFYDAVKAFEEVAKTNPTLELWVAGSYTQQIRDWILQSPVSDKVKLFGFRRDVYQLMQNALALLVPSYNEGFGFITTEAMLNRCIVIGRDTAGTKEQFDNGLNNLGTEIGLRFNNQKELILQMQSVLSMDKYLLNEMKENAHKVLSMYTIEQHIKKLVSYYNKLLQE